jgi:hypothetical protein
MKKTLITLVGIMSLVGCTKDDIFPYNEVVVPKTLEINNTIGIKLESSFVKSEVSMNVKMETAGTVTIKIFDFSNRVVSKETTTVKVGDNILKVHTNALPSSAYRIGLFDSNGNQLGITDFNKL